MIPLPFVQLHLGLQCQGSESAAYNNMCKYGYIFHQGRMSNQMLKLIQICLILRLHCRPCSFLFNKIVYHLFTLLLMMAGILYMVGIMLGSISKAEPSTSRRSKLVLWSTVRSSNLETHPTSKELEAAIVKLRRADRSTEERLWSTS